MLRSTIAAEWRLGALNGIHIKGLNSASFPQPFGDREDRSIAFRFLATGRDGNLSLIFP
jgi:hypothetical protein